MPWGGPYSPTSWVNGTTALSQTHMNNLETIYTLATTTFEQDLLTPFVLYGLTATVDPTTANQLDVSAGVAYLLQTDSTVARQSIAASAGPLTTSAHTATYYLDLNPNGTYSFATSHSGTTNYMTIAQVTTNGSGNISAVSDKRPISTTLFPSMAGLNRSYSTLNLPPFNLTISQNDAYIASVTGTVTFEQPGALIAGGDFNTAALFDGSTGLIGIPVAGLQTGAGAITLEAIAKPNVSSPGSYARVVGVGTAGTTNEEFSLNQPTGGGWQAGFWGSGVSGGASTAGTYYHLVATYDGTNVRLYVNGSLVAGPTAASGNIVSAGSAIGAYYNSGYTSFFNGVIDEVAIYNTALSAARVTAHYNAIAGSGYATAVLSDSPVRYYRLGEVQGSTSVGDTIGSFTENVFTADGALNVPGNATVQGTTTLMAGLAASIPSISSQATAGSYGVPLIVAQAIDVSVTSTSTQNILVFTPAASGIYQINGYFFHVNGSGATNCTFQVLYNEPHQTLGQTWTFYCGIPTGASNSPEFISSLSVANNAAVVCMPLVIQATSNSSHQITVQFHDASGTPADFVTVIIVRLA